LRQEAKGTGVEDVQLERSLDEAFITVSSDWLKSLVKPGAGADGQATLHYSAEISAELKSLYRKAALGVFDDLEACRSTDRDEAVAEVEQQLAELDAKAVAA